MDIAQIQELARGSRLTREQLNARMGDLRSKGVGILLCIKFVMTNQECSLSEAGNIVINSDAWVDRREAFLQEQEDALQEYIDHNIDRIAFVQQTITPDGTQTSVHMKPRD